MADKKYGKLSAPKKDETMEEDFEAEMLEGLEDEEDMDMAEESPTSDIADALAGFSKEEIEEYLATMEEEEELPEDEEEFTEPQMIMGDS